MEIIRISASSTPKLAAGAIASVIRTDKAVSVQAIGASAINQSVKSIAIARMYLERDKIDAVCRPGFVEIELDGTRKTGMEFQITAV
jgi:stage V sporulation protein S